MVDAGFSKKSFYGTKWYVLWITLVNSFFLMFCSPFYIKFMCFISYDRYSIHIKVQTVKNKA